ncbi:MAG TPA: copper resistance protein CopC [Candidatus Binatia bacterium]|jgi:methionine-rich copper-binding protein CopC|nr:copper resistance protein CopC [Candidatus Binatia bacterium]
MQNEKIFEMAIGRFADSVIFSGSIRLSQGKLRKLADDTMAIDLKPLGPGNHSVEWQVLSVDTHITDGTLRFTVGAAAK